MKKLLAISIILGFLFGYLIVEYYYQAVKPALDSMRVACPSCEELK